MGINTTNPQATLDIQASDSSNPSTIDGILIPKIDVFPSTNPGTEQQGLLVYLTTAVSDKLPGFYYWDHPTTSWIPIQGSSTANTAWNIEGNAETIAGTHFIGTTDAALLNFRVDNTQSGRIDYDSPFNTSLGFQTLISLTTGTSNTAIGYNALALTSTGESNVAVGTNALYHNEAHYNTAVGAWALYNNKLAPMNVAVGYRALYENTTGIFNTAVGYSALFNNSEGNHNSAFGNQVLSTNSIGNNNSALGS